MSRPNLDLAPIGNCSVSGEGVEGGDCAPHGGIGGAVGEGAVAASSLQTVHP